MKACVQYGHTPRIWQQNKSNIPAKPGKDNYNVPKSYRIITLSSNMLKILEKLILWHLQDDQEIEQRLKKTQFGFKKGHSTEAAISKMINKIQEALEHGEHIMMGVFLDIQGAFDNISILSIKRALNKTSAKGMVADWIINMISNRKIELNWGNKKIYRTIKKGCPQGGCLIPFLWNLVLDDLLQKFNNSDNIQAFADGLSLLNIGKTQCGINNNTKIIIMNWC